MLSMLLLGCTGPRPQPVATAAPVPTCLDEAQPELERMREHGQLDRTVDRLEQLQSTCGHEVDRALFEAYLAQDRWAEARIELKGKPWTDREALARRVAAAEARGEDPWSLVARAKTAAAPEAQRLRDRALAGFMRTTGQQPEAVFVDPVPRWKKANTRTIRHGSALLGGDGVVIEEPEKAPRWVSGRWQALKDDVVLFGLRGDARLWNLSTNETTSLGAWPDLVFSPGRDLVLLPTHPAKIYRLADLALVDADVKDPNDDEATEASWFDDEHILLEGMNGIAVYSLRRKQITARALGLPRAVSPDKTYLADIEEVSDAKWRLMVTDARTGAKRVDATIRGGRGPILTFSPDGRRLFLGLQGADLWAFELPSGRRRRLAKIPRARAMFSGLSAIEVSDDGTICLFEDFRAEPKCEPMLAVRPNGRVLPLRGPHAMTCVRGSEGVRVATAFRGAVTTGRTMVPGGDIPGYVNCNGAISEDRRTRAWFEAASGPEGLHDHVLVVHDDTSGNLLHTIPIDAEDAREVQMSLTFSGDRLHVAYNDRSFAVELATGKLEPWRPRPSWLSESSPAPTDHEKAYFSADPAALTTLEPPWGVWSKAARWDLRTLRGVYRDPVGGAAVDEALVGAYRLELADSMVWIEHLGAFFGVRFFGADRALVQHERGRLEPIGFTDDTLRCAFGDTVTPWSVCAERITPARGYREMLDIEQNGAP